MVSNIDNRPNEDISFHYKHHRAEFPEWCKLCWIECVEDERWDDEGGPPLREKS